MAHKKIPFEVDTKKFKLNIQKEKVITPNLHWQAVQGKWNKETNKQKKVFSGKTNRHNARSTAHDRRTIENNLSN